MRKMLPTVTRTFAFFLTLIFHVRGVNSTTATTNPYFAEPIQNVTAIRGRNATISCQVKDLGKYKVAWVHVDRKMVIAIHEKVTTRIPRFGVSFDGDKTTWRLHIYNVHEDDKGKYMCQLNTIPMQAQIGILNVVVPPWIDDQMSSASTISVPENSDVMLQCHARGFPTPSIEWRREDDLPIRLKSRGAVPKVDGSKLHLKGVTRKSMAPYLCIANNGYPPIVSKRITLDVEFAPTVAASESLVSGPLGFSVELHCVAEAYPKAMYYWTKNGSMVYDHSKYDQTNKARYPYETEMTLRIKNLTHDDFDVYGCVAKNSLGEDSGTIRLLQYGGRQNKESWFSSPSKSAASEIQTGAASSAHQPVTVTINSAGSVVGPTVLDSILLLTLSLGLCVASMCHPFDITDITFPTIVRSRETYGERRANDSSSITSTSSRPTASRDDAECRAHGVDTSTTSGDRLPEPGGLHFG